MRKLLIGEKIAMKYKKCLKWGRYLKLNIVVPLHKKKDSLVQPTIHALPLTNYSHRQSYSRFTYPSIVSFLAKKLFTGRQLALLKGKKHSGGGIGLDMIMCIADRMNR